MSRDDHVPTRIGDVLGPAAQELGIGDAAEAGWLWRRWDEIVGETIGRNARPSSLREGVLRVRASSAAWATEIGYLAAEIRRLVNRAEGRELVKEVKVWTGPPLPEQARERPAPQAPEVPVEEDRPADPIEAFQRAREAWQRRSRGPR